MLSRLKKIIKPLIFLALASGLLAGAWLAVAIVPELPELKVKDEQIYQEMRTKFLTLRWIDAYGIYLTLHQNSRKALLMQRYKAKRKRWDEEEDFRAMERARELDEREKNRAQKKEEYETRLVAIREKTGPEDARSLSQRWQESSPWQQTIILRERCNHYLNLERVRGQRRKNLLEPLRFREGRGVSKRGWSIAQICETLVPLGHDDVAVQHGIHELKNYLYYFDFKDLVSETGIQLGDSDPFPNRVKRLSRDLLRG